MSPFRRLASNRNSPSSTLSQGLPRLKSRDISFFLRKAKSSLRGLPAPDDPWYWPGGPSRNSFLFELQAEQLCILRLGWSGARSVSGPARPLSDTCLFIHREECNGLGLKSQDPGSRFCRCRWRCRGPREVHDRPLREPGNRPDALFHPS